MIEYWTGAEVAASVLMTRTTFKGTIAIVEGRGDCLVYEKFVDPELCQMQLAYGRPNVLEAMCSLRNPKADGIVAIVDADFWHLRGTPSPSPDILVTDLHDIETMMFESRAFDAIMAEYGSRAKITEFLGLSNATDLRTALLEAAMPLGLLRLVGDDGPPLKFKGLPLDKVIDKSTLRFSICPLIDRVLMLTENPTVKKTDIRRRLRTAKGNAHDPWQVCCGHDVAAIIGIGLLKALGNQPKTIANGENVERLLRLSFDSADFGSTRLFKQAKGWEKANAPFIIFS